MANTAATYPGTGADDSSIGSLTWASPAHIEGLSGYTYATIHNANGITHYLKGTNFGFSIPTTANINGIKLDINRSKSGPVTDNTVKLVKSDGTLGSTNKAGVSWSATYVTATYGGSTDLWGETWAASDINDADFGAVLAANILMAGTMGTGIAYVSWFNITVYYTVPELSVSDSNSLTESQSVELLLDLSVQDSNSPSESTALDVGVSLFPFDSISSTENTSLEATVYPSTVSDAPTASESIQMAMLDSELSVFDTITSDELSGIETIMEFLVYDAQTIDESTSFNRFFNIFVSDNATSDESIIPEVDINFSLYDAGSLAESISAWAGFDLVINDIITSDESFETEGTIYLSISDIVSYDESFASESVYDLVLFDAITSSEDFAMERYILKNNIKLQKLGDINLNNSFLGGSSSISPTGLIKTKLCQY